MNSIRTLVAIGALSCVASATANESGCLSAVEDQNYSAVVSACVDLPHGQRGGVAAALMAGDYTHHLGTPEAPSKALTQLHRQAAEGNRSAQYTYGMLYRMVFVTQDGDTPAASAESAAQLLERNAAVRSEAMVWIERAALQDHALAMLDVAKNLVARSYDDPEADLIAALNYARRARDLKNPLADLVVESIERRMSQLGQRIPTG